MEEKVQLIGSDEQSIIVKLPANGLRFVNGIASNYEDKYSDLLVGVITETELSDIIRRLNETIKSYWPCNACYIFGFVCSPFSLGLSLLCPAYCVSHSEKYANAMLENVSLKAKYYDRRITFRIVKTWVDSYVEIAFPAKLVSEIDRLENGTVTKSPGSTGYNITGGLFGKWHSDKDN